jgi:putative flippase GtrA
MTILNPILLTLLVAVCGMSPIVANLSRTLMTTPTRFGLQRHIIRNERRSGPFWQELRYYLTLKAGLMVAQQTGFWVLFSLLAVNYVLAYLVCTAAIGLLSMVLSSKLVFWDRDA